MAYTDPSGMKLFDALFGWFSDLFGGGGDRGQTYCLSMGNGGCGAGGSPIGGFTGGDVVSSDEGGASFSFDGGTPVLFQAQDLGKADVPVVSTPPNARLNPAKNKACGSTGAGFGFGLVGGANADIGLGMFGASANGTVGAGLFYDSGTGPAAGAFASGGAVARTSSQVTGAPAQAANASSSFGAFAGAGAGLFLTNARSASQLKGPFPTLNFNAGFAFAQLQISWASSGGIWYLQISPPLAGVSVGASVSTFTTTTAATSGGCR